MNSSVFGDGMSPQTIALGHVTRSVCAELESLRCRQDIDSHNDHTGKIAGLERQRGRATRFAYLHNR